MSNIYLKLPIFLNLCHFKGFSFVCHLFCIGLGFALNLTLISYHIFNEDVVKDQLQNLGQLSNNYYT